MRVMSRLMVFGVLSLAVILSILVYYYYWNRPPVEVKGAYAVSTGFSIGVFMDIRNNLDSTLCLVEVSLLENVEGARAELHKSEQTNGRHVMRPVDRVCLDPKSSLGLKPGGYHVMVMAPPHIVQRIIEDGVVRLELKFVSGEKRVFLIDVDAPLRGESRG